ncbi:MAG: ATP-binding protein [Actinomycetota bacterium]
MRTAVRRAWFGIARSLGLKLVLGSLAVEVVMLTALVLTNTGIMTASLAEQTATRMAEVETLLNASLAVPLVQRDNGALNDVLTALRRHQGFEYLVLEDTRGTVLARSGWPDGVPPPPPSVRKPTEVGGRWDAEVPITMGGQTYGHLHFGIATGFFAEARRAMTRISLAIAAAEVLLSAGLLSLIGFWLTRRLRAVTLSVEAVAGGDLGTRARVGSGHDEIDRLGASFNVMAEALDQRVRELARLYQAVECSPVSIVITDTQGAIEYVNPQFCAATGYSAEEVLGANPRVLKSGEMSADHYVDMWSKIMAGQMWYGTFHNRRKDGRLFWEEAAIAPVKDEGGRVTHFVAIKVDVTERRAKERELRQAVDSLTAANTELERFAYVASHDLQEPLRTVVSFAQLLERRFRDQLGPEGQEYIQFLVGASTRMHWLINDLLAYSRIGVTDRPFGPVRARAACDAALENLQDSIGASGATVEVGDLPVVLGDEVQLMQVFQNLIGNALKFHAPGHAPRVTVRADRDPDGAWRFAVTDDGIGFDPSEQDVFEIFRRLHPAHEYPGSGVGLTVCKRIVQRHNGRIWVESAPGAGSTFSFTLPAAGPA